MEILEILVMVGVAALTAGTAALFWLAIRLGTPR